MLGLLPLHHQSQPVIVDRGRKVIKYMTMSDHRPRKGGKVGWEKPCQDHTNWTLTHVALMMILELLLRSFGIVEEKKWTEWHSPSYMQIKQLRQKLWLYNGFAARAWNWLLKGDCWIRLSTSYHSLQRRDWYLGNLLCDSGPLDPLLLGWIMEASSWCFFNPFPALAAGS